MVTSEILKKKEEELEWWNKFSPIMAMQWELTPELNTILRTDFIDDFTGFLYKKDGHLLDVGCGNGWIARIFAELGMKCTGIDFSDSQINLAKSLSSTPGHDRIEYLCTDVIDFNYLSAKMKFDSIIVNALLHHLSENEIIRVIKNLEGLLTENGRIYFYEPFIFNENVNKPFDAKLIVWISKLLSIIYKLNTRLFLTNAFYKKYKKLGYQGKSPHERSFSSDLVINAFSDRVCVDDIRPFHVFSLTFGTHLLSLKRIPRNVLIICTKPIYKIEQFLFKSGRWKSITNEKWVLSGLKIIKT